MPEIVWDAVGEKLYETGVSKGVLYPRDAAGLYPLGVPWNGLTGVTESPSGAEATAKYADNIKYGNLLSAEEFAATLEAFTYPDEFGQCDGSAEIAPGVKIGQQSRKSFGLAYRTELGNDVDNDAYGYKLHLIYGATAAPSEKGYQTINDTPDMITFSWELSTIPVVVSGFKPTASLVIDSTKVLAANLEALEAILYGTAGTDPRLPLPDEVAALFAGAAPDALELVSIVPDNDAPDIAINSNIVLTFNNKIATEAIVVSTEAGVIVPGAKTWDEARKILTFDPTENLVNSTTYRVTITGVTDVYGDTLTPEISEFTTIGL